MNCLPSCAGLFPGYHCTGGSSGIPLQCTSVCGDGLRVPPEQCDDGNNIGSDGCSSTCIIEPMWVCTGGSPTSKDTCLSIPYI